jgi:F-type H+-transporting ATPase subunit gamma
VLQDLARRVDLSAHPLLVRRPVKKVEIVVLTSDRGLCGGFNASVVRKVQRYRWENEERLEKIWLRTIGRKGLEAFRRRGAEVRKDHPGLFKSLSYSAAEALAAELTGEFLAGEVDAIFLAYNEFVSAVSQKVALVELLPIRPPEGESAQAEAASGQAAVDYEYEPGREQVLADLLPRYVASEVWRALLESVASEHGARMSAMDSATKNASDMIGRLTLQYNRTRQAGITKELMEIVSGAEALK